MRQPIVAGQFYAGEFGELDKQIKDCFEEGPGCEPGNRKRSLKGVIVPHAGYSYSGACAAWSYKAIGEAEFADAYLLIGLNHNGNESAFSDEDWLTPFGAVKNHFLTKELSQATGIPIRNEAHYSEHSIEVQLPFLQMASRDKLAELRIIPLMIGSEMDFVELAGKISKVIEGKKVILITSSDFTHYGSAYGYLPFTGMKKEAMYELDKKAIKYIVDLDSKGFLKYVKETGATICGKNPIALTIELMKGNKGFLERYYTSGDVSGDYDTQVGYASVLFR